MKRHIISAAVTFVSTFLTTFATALAVVPTETFTSAGWTAIIGGLAVTAVRAAIKPAVEAYILK